MTLNKENVKSLYANIEVIAHNTMIYAGTSHHRLPALKEKIYNDILDSIPDCNKEGFSRYKEEFLK